MESVSRLLLHLSRSSNQSSLIHVPLFKLWLNSFHTSSAKRSCINSSSLEAHKFSRERRELPYTSILCNYRTDVRCGRRLEETLLIGQKEERGSEGRHMTLLKGRNTA